MKGDEIVSVLTFQSEEFKTFPAVLREYAAYASSVKGNSEKTVCEYLLDLRTFFRFYKKRRETEFVDPNELETISIADITIDTAKEITSYNVVEFIMFAGMQKKNNGNTRMRKLSALRSFYNYLTKKKGMENNPTVNVEGPKAKKSLPKYLTLDESVRLLETVRNDTESKTNVRDFCILTLFLNTGMRLSELVGLNFDSFDPDLTKVRVLGKGNKERFIYINDAARSAIEGYLRIRLDPQYIATSEKAMFISRLEERISPKTVQWMVYKYLDMAGLGNRGLSVHKLRHTAATLMYQSGEVDVRVLKDVLGHEQLNTTQIYTHIIDRNMEQAVQHNPLANLKIKRKPLKNDVESD